MYDRGGESKWGEPIPTEQEQGVEKKSLGTFGTVQNSASCIFNWEAANRSSTQKHLYLAVGGFAPLMWFMMGGVFSQGWCLTNTIIPRGFVNWSATQICGKIEGVVIGAGRRMRWPHPSVFFSALISRSVKTEAFVPLFFFFFFNRNLGYIYYRIPAKSSVVNNSQTMFIGGINNPLGVTYNSGIKYLSYKNWMYFSYLSWLIELFQQFPKSLKTIMILL